MEKNLQFYSNGNNEKKNSIRLLLIYCNSSLQLQQNKSFDIGKVTVTTVKYYNITRLTTGSQFHIIFMI